MDFLHEGLVVSENIDFFSCCSILCPYQEALFKRKNETKYKRQCIVKSHVEDAVADECTSGLNSLSRCLWLINGKMGSGITRQLSDVVSSYSPRNPKHALILEDPPMPRHFGEPTEIGRMLLNRQSGAAETNNLIKIAMTDVKASLERAHEIPQLDDNARVQVTDQMYDSMAARRSRRENLKFNKALTYDIQRSLALRKHSFKVMNDNYDRCEVSELEPIYAKDARTLTTYYED
jgi:hypothetical protein